jgi:hypothetical protein
MPDFARNLEIQASLQHSLLAFLCISTPQCIVHTEALPEVAMPLADIGAKKRAVPPPLTSSFGALQPLYSSAI